MLYYLLPVLEMYVELVTNFGYFCFFFRVYDLYLGILCLFDVKLEETKKKVKKLWRVFVLLSLLFIHVYIVILNSTKKGSCAPHVGVE